MRIVNVLGTRGLGDMSNVEGGRDTVTSNSISRDILNGGDQMLRGFQIKWEGQAVQGKGNISMKV